LHLIDHLIAACPDHLLQINRTTTFMESTISSDLGFVPIADFYPADGFSLMRTLSPADGRFAFGELLFIAIKSNQKALARLRSKARLKTRCPRRKCNSHGASVAVLRHPFS
jgi:hypothetical protein